MLFSMLDGSSVMSKLLSGFLGMVGSSPELSFYMKVMVVETLAHAEQMMEVQAATQKSMGAMMKVLINERNKVVFDDLEKLIAEEPQVKSVALFFGAGHLADMQERLEAMGYSESGVIWKDAVDIDSGSIKGGKAIIRQVRKQVEGMLPKSDGKGRKPKDEPKDAAAQE
jgi:pheromone shutdown protein TraB